jgi:hypothetical protein
MRAFAHRVLDDAAELFSPTGIDAAGEAEFERFGSEMLGDFQQPTSSMA